LERNPTLLGLDKLLEARLLDVPMDNRSDVELVKNLVHKRTRNLAMYHCANCGFNARQFYWHCPACQAWDSYSPRALKKRGNTMNDPKIIIALDYPAAGPHSRSPTGWNLNCAG